MPVNVSDVSSDSTTGSLSTDLLSESSIQQLPSASMNDPGPVLVTTTIFTGPAHTASVSPVSTTSPSPPIAAIAGGTAGGIVLAVAAVIAWTWWGRSLKRKAAKERAEYLSALQVRENTRRNASLSLVPSRVSASSIPQPQRKVTFVQSDPPSTAQSTSTTETIKVPADPNESSSPSPSDISTVVPNSPSQSMNFSQPLPKPLVAESSSSSSSVATYTVPHKPVNPSPLSQSLHNPNPSPEPTAPSTSRFSSNLIFPIPRNRDPPPPPPPQPTLTHKGSTLSDGSVYSTQSAEEQYIRAPQSLIMAALGHLDLRKQPSGGFLRAYRPNANNNEQSRLSQISTGSGYSHIDEEDVVGYAA